MHPWLALGAPEYVLERRQWVPGRVEDVFGFFQDPHNLPRITPSDKMGFRIVAMEPDHIRQGTRITYKLRVNGVPTRWVTVIEEWEPGRRFVDTQESGPYILWHHTHTFEEKAGGVLLGDRVRYRIPFGPLGMVVHALMVRRQLQEIFDFRQERIAEIYSGGVVHREAPGE